MPGAPNPRKVAARNPTFWLLPGPERRVSSAVIADITPYILEILLEYEQSNQGDLEPYPLILGLLAVSQKSARLIGEIIVDTILHQVETAHYPYTLHWWSVESAGYPVGSLLTVALRPCDLRDLVGQ